MRVYISISVLDFLTKEGARKKNYKRFLEFMQYTQKDKKMHKYFVKLLFLVS